MSAISTGPSELFFNEFNRAIKLMLNFLKDRVEPRMVA
jgi:hypothetical protein